MATQSHTDDKATQMIDTILEEMPEASEGIRRDFRVYFETGVCRLSGFYLALLTNDLFYAHRRADAKNMECLNEWLSWMYWEIPASAWGSMEEVQSYGGIASSDIPDQEQR